MSITRAFTTRKVKQSLELCDASEGLASRSNTASKSSSRTSKPPMSIRDKISAPVQLVSTTNMLSYNAPDIYPKTASSPGASTKSDYDSDNSHGSYASTPPTSPDMPHPTHVKKTAPTTSSEPNHLSCYFTPGIQAINPSARGQPAPLIPQRAPSRTKKHSQELLTKQRSLSQLSEQSSTRTLSSKASFSFSRTSSASTRLSAASHASSTAPPHKLLVAPPSNSLPTMSSSSSWTPPPPSAPPVSHRRELSASVAHPFGHELAQVSELAEEYSPKEATFIRRQEERDVQRQGFKKYSAQDYMVEVQDVYDAFFDEVKQPTRPLWI